ncbi:dihydrolipoamide acetyltransferase family protein [Peribacillus simplex]|uniref:Dihydrolipoamide acetyltransferase component of pyruvate dehydrogenase complex n=2 Tax=Peribacillus TaxID=2675229 RepID=A0AA90PJ94_9BACI|nr:MULTISPECIES: dihydrolipoamide acetyltransferase family protein [Peribacillus]MDP1419082.1 dihydrolipoamide acetyltransferase family protein [Peribacillus simplex]MDP1451775.1 dihydrolipoamide acetyltransferase family protein [Peribacillus frigoritolerans]
MAVEVVMPKLGMAMKEGTVSLWSKAVGDPVEKGEAIASINSEKIEMDIESPAEGTILNIAVQEGQGVPPGTVICHIGKPNEKIMINDHVSEETQSEIDEQEKPKTKESPILPMGDRLLITPVARKMAQAANLDIEKIQGSGPGGRITKEDVQKVIEKRDIMSVNTEERKVNPQPTLESPQQIPVTGMRNIIATRMKESLQSSAQLTLTLKVDVTDLVILQKQAAETLQKHESTKLTITDFVAKAVVLSLKEHPKMNSAYIEDKINLYEHIHLGLAVALENGLVVPVIRNAESCSLKQLSNKGKELARCARDGQLPIEDMHGSTFTISNLGAYGVEHFTPILNTPETGILGIGSAYDTPRYIGEELERRTILPLSLTFDHRVLDGAPAAAFLQTLKRYLEEPITVLL